MDTIDLVIVPSTLIKQDGFYADFTAENIKNQHRNVAGSGCKK